MKLNIEQLRRRFARMVEMRGVFEGEWEDAYRFAFPQRESWYHDSPGENRSRLIFDETAVEGVQEFASTMSYGLTPSFAQWFRLEPGALRARTMKDNDKLMLQAALDEVTSYCFAAIQSSEFETANVELFLDEALGWSTMWVDESDDSSRLLDFRVLPQTQVFIDLGPGAKPDGRFRRYKLTPEEFATTYGAQAKPLRLGENEKTRCSVVDAVYRDWDERGDELWHRQVFKETGDEVLWEKEYKGFGSCPVITPRWSTTSFEPYGRGPLYNVLPAIRTVNLVTQMTLENAELAIAGLWQGDDDGVINFDSINLLPGTIVPRDPESRGIEPLQSPSRFDVSNLVIQNMQGTIRRALFVMDLGPMDKTPMSATEAAERQSQLARRIGAPFSRLMVEYLTPLVRRVVHVLEKAGKIEVPKVDGRSVQVVSRSPLARAQRQESVLQFSHFDGLLKQTFGPELAPMFYNDQKTLEHLVEKLEIPPALLADEQQRGERMQQAMQAAQAQPPGPGQGGPTGV